MAYPFEISVDPGAAEGDISVRVLNSLSGGQPSVVARLDISALIAECETLEGTVQESVDDRGPESPAEVMLRNVGRQLFDAVFSGEVDSAYRSSYAVASERHDKLRLVLRLSDPRLAGLPWEAMYDKRIDEFVCRNEPLVRHVAASSVPIPLAVKPPLRILGLVSSPSDLPPLSVDDEKARLSTALAKLERKGVVHVEWVDRPDWESVHAKLRDETWHVLHFIGHGEYDDEAREGTIALVDENGRSHMVDADRFADLLNQGSAQPRLVVLNSCQSGRTGTRDVFSSSAATLVRRGTSAVAAMQFTVSDAAAVTFARGFYDSLSQGDTVDQAVQSGRISILGADSLEWVTPVLYVRGDTSRLFDFAPPVAPKPAIVEARPPVGDPAKRWTRRRAWLAGVLTLAIVVPLVAWVGRSAGHWFIGKVSPEQVLSAVVQVPSPAHSCTGGGQGWVFDTAPSDLPGVLPDDDKDAWAAANGGIPASGNYVVVTLQGLNGHTVVVNGISVDVVSRTEPPQGSYPYTIGSCGGLTPYRFSLDLDAKPVSVTAVEDEGFVEGEPRRPVELPHAVSGSQPEVWHLSAITAECDCEWTATLNWTSDGVEGHTEITNDGKPFRVAAVTDATHLVTDFEGGWVCVDDSVGRTCPQK
jgi:hypothetical protein